VTLLVDDEDLPLKSHRALALWAIPDMGQPRYRKGKDRE
jgi:hypothetical protein